MSQTHRNIPDDFRGVWKRTLLQTSTDTASPPVQDRDSWVRWLQTSLWHGDLRIPASALNERRALALRDMSLEQLGVLATQQGFTGVTQFEALPEGLICTWLRRVDYQPPGCKVDAGWMVFDRPDRLIEIGVHDDYNEIWERQPDSTGRYIALAGSDAFGRDDGRRLLLAGVYMMMIKPRHARWPRGVLPGHTLAQVLSQEPAHAVDWLDCEISYGQVQQGQWHVEHSTLPEREGQRQAFQLHRLDEGLASLTLSDQMGHWHVLEWSCNATDIRD